MIKGSVHEEIVISKYMHQMTEPPNKRIIDRIERETVLQ